MSKNSFFGGLFVLVMAVAIDLYAALVTFHGWQWYAVPLGLPVVGYAHVLGLLLLKTVIAPSKSPDDMDFDEVFKACEAKVAHLAVTHLFMWTVSGAM